MADRGEECRPKPAKTSHGHPQRMRLGRAVRLVASHTFHEAYSQGRRFAGRYMVLWLRSGEDAALRVGVVAGRKIGSAVMRNRAKRRLREVFRRHRPRLQGNVDVVLVAKAGCDRAPWRELVEDFLRLAERAGLVHHAV